MKCARINSITMPHIREEEVLEYEHIKLKAKVIVKIVIIERGSKVTQRGRIHYLKNNNNKNRTRLVLFQIPYHKEPLITGDMLYLIKIKVFHPNDQCYIGCYDLLKKNEALRNGQNSYCKRCAKSCNLNSDSTWY